MPDTSVLPSDAPLAASENLMGAVAEAIAERSRGLDVREFSEFSPEEQAQLFGRAGEILATRNDIVQRGQTLYNQTLRMQLETTQAGKFLVLDVDTGDYEIDDNDLAAMRRAQAKRPDGVFYLLRVGSPSAYRLRRNHSEQPL